MGEIILIAVVALLAVGPDRLPQAARSIGRGIRDIRKQTDELQYAIEEDSQIGDAVRELRSAWQGTARHIPRNRHELGQAVDKLTRGDDPPSKPGAPAEVTPQASGGEPAAPEPSAADAAAADAPADRDETPGEGDDGMPRIAAPAGIVAHSGGAAKAEGDRASSPAEGGAGEPSDERNPAHG